MSDIARLQIRVESLEAEVAKRRLSGLSAEGGRAQRATDGLTGAFKKLIAPLAAAVSAAEGLGKLVAVQREFDKLNAGLITATGSSENAAVAFEALTQFAANTPYDLAQVTDSFTKLVNLGLTPSERALTSYGNTASAMGKDLNQLIEAVADAATGEFERLKEFGIKSSSEGDRVKFTFRGVTTEIGKNAAEIEQYLMALGENEFAGNMENRMDTLDGAISNLGDTWDATFRNISQAGAGEAIQDIVVGTTAALDDLNMALASGQLEVYLEAIAGKFSGLGEDAQESLDLITSAFEGKGEYWEKLIGLNVDNMIATFKNLPENVRAFIQLMTVEVLSGYDKVVAYSSSFAEGIEAIFSDDTLEGVGSRLEARLRVLDQVRQESIVGILDERDAALRSYDEQIAKADALRKAEEDRRAASTGAGDRLAGFGIDRPAAGEGGPSAAEQKAAAALEKRQKKEFESLVAALRTEEEAIQVSYDRRLAIINANTEAESTTRARLMERLERWREEELASTEKATKALDDRRALAEQVADIEESLWTDAQRAAAAYQVQIETLWQALQKGVLTQAEHEQAVDRVTAAYEKQQDKATVGYVDLEELGKSASRNIQSSFADFLFDPFDDGVDGMVLGFAKAVQRMAAEAAAAQLASKLLGSGGSSGGGLLGMIATVAGSYFGGAGAGASGAAAASLKAGASQAGYANLNGFVAGRASGGPTERDRLYEVGEFGRPELLRQNGRNYLLPGNSGSVTPLSSGQSSSGPVHVSIQVNVEGGSGAVSGEDTQSDESAGNARELAEAMRGVALEEISRQSRPGGLLWKIQQQRA